MPTPVSKLDKKNFMRWFLKRFEMKRRECVWILNYIVGHDELLEKIHFVEDANFCPRAMVMSTTETTGIPFRFYKGNLMTADAEKAFHDLRIHADEPMYIQLNFPKNGPNALYLSVLEENQFTPRYLQKNIEDEKIAQQVLEESISSFQLENLRQQIDEALDQGNKERFIELSSLLNQLLKE